ncbi:MAG TPA: outer membrane protein transport protein [Thermoanaerobaculia bacterium]|jgi:long-chain fatty acid transport protein|nr:outer membrane protein transport protein [Thermoanaerobaculia bacterium]
MRRSFVLLLTFVLASGAFAGGFQVTAQSARAMGMGLASTGVASDASAIYFNPAGLAFQNDPAFTIGGLLATNLEAQYTGPGGLTEEQTHSLNVLPQLYYAQPIGPVRLGIGAYTPFGLPLQWDDRDTFSGRHVSYLANIRTLNLNPTAAFKLGPVGVGVGVDWVHSKIQLERRRGQTFPGLGFRDIADAKLESDLADSDGWGWNAGVMWKGGPLQLGAAYRSAIDVDHDAELSIAQIPTGVAPIDAAVGAQLPHAALDAAVPVEFPASLNLGASLTVGNTIIAAEADRTDWSSFSQLQVQVPTAPAFGTTRSTNWDDTWAYRLGVELPCGAWRCRAGYYKDQTPQPLADVGPVLPDADRNGLTVGLGIPVGGAWTLDVGYVHVLFDDRTTTASTTDALAGLWETTGAELAVNLRYH